MKICIFKYSTNYIRLFVIRFWKRSEHHQEWANHQRIQSLHCSISMWKHWLNQFASCSHMEVKNMRTFVWHVTNGQLLSQVSSVISFLFVFVHISKRTIKIIRRHDANSAQIIRRVCMCGCLCMRSHIIVSAISMEPKWKKWQFHAYTIGLICLMMMMIHDNVNVCCIFFHNWIFFRLNFHLWTHWLMQSIERNSQSIVSAALDGWAYWFCLSFSRRQPIYSIVPNSWVVLFMTLGTLSSHWSARSMVKRIDQPLSVKETYAWDEARSRSKKKHMR